MEHRCCGSGITELRADRDTAQAALNAITPDERQTEDDYLTERLQRLPDLAAQLQNAPREIKRQTFEAFARRARAATRRGARRRSP